MQASQARDSNVNLPRAIVRRSAAIQARIDAQREPKTDPADPNAPPADPSAASATPSDPPAPPVEPAAPAADPRENDPAYWRQRFNVTAGVLKAERTAHQGKIDELTRKMTEMQEQVRTLQVAAPTSESKLDAKQFFTPEQIEQFGEEQCEAMATAAMKSAQAAVQQAIEAEVKPLREQREREKAQTIEERKQAFTDKLGELVPGYAEIDTDPAWLAWLAQEDEASGLERQAILNQHINTLNAVKVAKVFQDYLKSKAPAPRPTPPVVGKGNGAGPSGDAPPEPPASSLKAPSDAEVKDFFKRSALGRVKDTERVEFEARLKLRNGR